MKNLVKLYIDADKSGISWYVDANLFARKVAEQYNKPLKTVCAVISALSPATNWEQNKADTIGLISGKKGYKCGTYGRNVAKAREILKTNEALFSPKTGAKTYNFFYNIWQPENPDYVCIDRHAYLIATNDIYTGLTPKQYEKVANHYRKSAKKLGVLPNQLQSVLWVDYRLKEQIQFANKCPF